MKTLRYLCLLSIIFLTQSSILTPSLHGFSQQQSTELAEADSLIENARKLFKEGKHKDALPTGEARSRNQLARFSPTKLSGMPVKVQGYITYNFLFR